MEENKIDTYEGELKMDCVKKHCQNRMNETNEYFHCEIALSCEERIESNEVEIESDYKR